MMNYIEFVNFYNTKGFCLNDISRSKNKLNEKQLESKYKKYCKSENKKKTKVKKVYKIKTSKIKVKFDREWEIVARKVRERDNNQCRLTPLLTNEELIQLRKNGSFLLSTIDPAHIISRSTAPQLKYCIDNIALLNRYSHSMLDTYNNPITGKPIDKEDHGNWWIRIIGHELYDKLRSMK